MKSQLAYTLKNLAKILGIFTLHNICLLRVYGDLYFMLLILTNSMFSQIYKRFSVRYSFSCRLIPKCTVPQFTIEV